MVGSYDLDWVEMSRLHVGEMEAASSRVTAFMNVVDVINGNGSIAPARFHKHATAVACLQSHAGPSAKVHAHIFFILRPYTLTDPT